VVLVFFNYVFELFKYIGLKWRLKFAALNPFEVSESGHVLSSTLICVANVVCGAFLFKLKQLVSYYSDDFVLGGFSQLVDVGVSGANSYGPMVSLLVNDAMYPSRRIVRINGEIKQLRRGAINLD
jgi:hypothetical protein